NSTLRVAGDVWTAGTAPIADFTALAFAPTVGCGGSSLTRGIFVAVGANATSANSIDGQTFTGSIPPIGFTTDLNSVVGFVSNPSVLTIQFVAVGAGGASILSPDGANWSVGAPFDSSAPTLRAISVNLGTFLAVGDGGAAQTSID